ncbi:MAG: purine permease [Bacilli bacterium]|nr:purine permease [Bacilli bacterium]
MQNPFKRFAQFYREGNRENVFRLDGAVPLRVGIPFGLQHVLSMFVANIAPILICFMIIAGAGDISPAVKANAIRSAIFLAAVGTTIQLFPIGRIGAKLPIVVGVSFTFLGVLGLVGATYGLGTMFVSIIIGGLVIGVLGLFANKWRRFIKPIVSAVVVLGIGLSLISVGIKDFIGYNVAGNVVDGVYRFDVAWPYLLVASVTLLSSILWQIFVKGVWKNISVLFGLVVGYLLSLCFIPYNHMVDFSAFQFTSFTDFIDVPRPFFTLVPIGWESFRFGAILTVLLIYVVATTEGIGDISSLTSSGLGRDPTDREISGGIAADGFISALAGFFGTMPLTTFSQNVGIVGQTKIVNRFTIFQGALLLFLAAFITPITTFLQTIPSAVLGGTMLMLFSSIVVIGMQMISKVGFTKKNIMIVSLSVGLGYGITLISEFVDATPWENDFLKSIFLILQNPVANMFLLSFLFSYIIPDSINTDKPKEKKEEEIPKQG